MDGVTTVNTAGASLPVGESIPCQAVVITALSTNTGIVYIGRAPGAYKTSTGGVYYSDGPSKDTKAGRPLSRGESTLIEYVKLVTDVWVDAATDGDGVSWSAEPREDCGCQYTQKVETR